MCDDDQDQELDDFLDDSEEEEGEAEDQQTEAEPDEGYDGPSLEEIQEDQIEAATDLGVDEQDPYTSDDDEEEDVDDYCDECAALLDRDGNCLNDQCSTTPCPACDLVGEACQCPPRSEAQWMAIREERARADHRKALAEAATQKMLGERPTLNFTSTEEFEQHLSRKREKTSIEERRRRSEHQFEAKVKKYG